MSLFSNRRVGIILIAGLVLREVFSPWTGHPFDFELWVRTGYWVAQGVSPYGVISSAPGLTFASGYSPSAESTVAYLPFWPLLLAGIYKLYALVGFGDRFVYYFLIKQPIILGDVLLGYAIMKYVRAKGSKSGEAVLSMWLLSPYTVILSGIWGMFDALAVLPVVVALSVASGTQRSALEGLSIWVKSIPVIFAIPIAASGKNKLRNLILAGLIPAVGTLGAIVLLRWPISIAFATLNSTVGKGGQSMSAVSVFFYLQNLGVVNGWPGPLLDVLGLVWVPALLIVTWLAYRWFGFDTERGLVRSLLLCAITFLLFKAQVNEQYAVYLLALALLDVGAWSPDRRWLYFSITAAVTGYIAINNPALVSFSAPLYSQAAEVNQSFDMALGPIRFSLLALFSLAFSALNVFYFYLLVKERKRAGGPAGMDFGPARNGIVPCLQTSAESMSIFVMTPSTLSPAATSTAGTNLKSENRASTGVSPLTTGKLGCR